MLYLYIFSTNRLQLLFTQNVGSPNAVDIFMPMCLIIWSSEILIFICEIGQNVSNQCNELSDDIWKCDWYSLPHEFQRMFIIMIMNAQAPISIRGLGNIVCARVSYKRVVFLSAKYGYKSHFNHI